MIVDILVFIRPYAEKRIVPYEVSDDLKPQLEAMMAAGCRLTAEGIPPNLLNICVEEPKLGNFDMILVKNSINNKKELEQMIRRFKTKNFDKWKGISKKQQ